MLTPGSCWHFWTEFTDFAASGGLIAIVVPTKQSRTKLNLFNMLMGLGTLQMIQDRGVRIAQAGLKAGVGNIK